MNVFLDANILVSVLNKEYPLFHHTSRILSLNNIKGFRIFTSPLCLAIAFYFAEKKHGRAIAKKKISLLVANISITTVDEDIVTRALQDKQASDFEDALEYYSAKQFNCKCIVTEDKGDFFYSSITVLNTDDFVGRFMNH